MDLGLVEHKKERAQSADAADCTRPCEEPVLVAADDGTVKKTGSRLPSHLPEREANPVQSRPVAVVARPKRQPAPHHYEMTSGHRLLYPRIRRTGKRKMTSW